MMPCLEPQHKAVIMYGRLCHGEKRWSSSLRSSQLKRSDRLKNTPKQPAISTQTRRSRDWPHWI